MSDEIHEMAKKMLQKAAAGSSPAQPKGKKSAKSKGMGSAPESELGGSTDKPQRVKTAVENEQAGPDEQLMGDIQKMVPGKKKALSESEDLSSPPPRRGRSKAAPKSDSGAEDSPAPAAKRTDPHIPEDSAEISRNARHEQLLSEYGNKDPDFEMLERDLPKGGGSGGNVDVPHSATVPGPMGRQHSLEGPLTVGGIAAQLLLQSMPNGERSDVPGGSLEANDESKLAQLQNAIPSRHQGMKVAFNPVASEVGNKAQLPQGVKGSLGVRSTPPMNRIMPGSPKDVMDRAEAEAFAEELRRNFPDQIAK